MAWHPTEEVRCRFLYVGLPPFLLPTFPSFYPLTVSPLTDLTSTYAQILASASYDDTIKLYTEDPSEDDWFCFSTLTGHESTVWALAWCPGAVDGVFFLVIVYLYIYPPAGSRSLYLNSLTDALLQADT